MADKGRMLIFGHGYTAAAFSRGLLAQGWAVTGTTRSRMSDLAAQGVTPLQWPGNEQAVRDEIAHADGILISAAPDDQGDPVLREFAHEIATANPRWVGYLSSSSVYGDHGGHWVNETAQTQPTSLHGKRRLQAEQDWQAFSRKSGVAVDVFRLAGIYGPQRSVFDRLRSGKAKLIEKPGLVFARIHVEDISTILQLGMAQGAGNEIYNLGDDLPASPQDVMRYAAEISGMPLPKTELFNEAGMSPMALSFYKDSKKLCNKKVKEALNVSLRYPSYREGLEAIWEAQRGSGSSS